MARLVCSARVVGLAGWGSAEALDYFPWIEADPGESRLKEAAG
jgi:hypothetical protein